MIHVGMVGRNLKNINLFHGKILRPGDQPAFGLSKGSWNHGPSPCFYVHEGFGMFLSFQPCLAALCWSSSNSKTRRFMLGRTLSAFTRKKENFSGIMMTGLDGVLCKPGKTSSRVLIGPLLGIKPTKVFSSRTFSTACSLLRLRFGS